MARAARYLFARLIRAEHGALMTEPVSEERQKAYFDKARKGMLAWLAKREGAAATLGDSARAVQCVLASPARPPSLCQGSGACFMAVSVSRIRARKSAI